MFIKALVLESTRLIALPINHTRALQLATLACGLHLGYMNGFHTTVFITNWHQLIRYNYGWVHVICLLPLPLTNLVICTFQRVINHFHVIPLLLVASLMGPTTSLVTTSRMQQCFYVLTDIYNVFVLLFHCFVLLEIKLTITTTIKISL